MQKPKEIEEIAIMLRYLPLKMVAKIKQQVLALKEQCGYAEPTDDSDEWSEEDLQDFARACALYAEHAVPWNPIGEPESPPTSPDTVVDNGASTWK